MSIESSLKLLAESSARQATAMEALLAHLTSGAVVEAPKQPSVPAATARVTQNQTTSAPSVPTATAESTSTSAPPAPVTTATATAGSAPPAPVTTATATAGSAPPVPETPSLDIKDSTSCNAFLVAEYERLGANPEVMQRIFGLMEKLYEVRSVNDLTEDQYSPLILAVRELS